MIYSELLLAPLQIKTLLMFYCIFHSRKNEPASSSKTNMKKSENDQSHKNRISAAAMIKVKRKWQTIEPGGLVNNFLKDGILKNTKRMRFEIKSLILKEDD